MIRASCFVVMFASTAAFAGAQSLVWQQVATAGPGPRHLHAMATDEARQQVVLFGGVGGEQQTWTWNGAAWTQATPAASPPGRMVHAMAYDGVSQRALLFGGMIPISIVATQIYGDTWAWDGSTWVEVTPANGPSPRSGHAMVRDAARDRVVLFGGQAANGANLAETWEWDGAAWSLVPATPSPPVRFGHQLAYDAARQRVVMFGGFGNGGARLGDVWEWDGVAWTEVTPAAGPAARAYHAMAFDPARQRTLLFGGFGTATLGDTWEWDGATWTDVTPPVGAPATNRHAMVLDPVHGRPMLFGGAAVPGDTWRVDTGSLQVTATATTYGAGCGSTMPQLLPDPSMRPILGQTARVDLVSAPTSAAWAMIGWSNTMMGTIALPFTLSPLGMTGCDLWQSAAAIDLAMAPTGPDSATFSLALPNAIGLLGVHVFVQALVFAPGENAFGFVVSDAVDWRIGDV